ncbi:uncharacterized protein lrrc53 [Phyllopteryx taeniolatus]|uniref:uncharacterized protein lrrc53 n=1 Tax=Phyllopteryx taeniolatus TaxID=161469 RepID=UPI002AD4F866|nr:uncharacterized protein lrrc53 [Phyllopteryx taeniolatus]
MDELSFRNLPFLHTLLLDHNLLTSQALEDKALSNLAHLQVLALGHNLISQIQANWLKGTLALRTLNLEGNRISSLDPGSLPFNELRYLENLDLSDNFIKSLDTNSFHGLVRLRNLDMSRNRLSSAPSQSFSYLSWLTNLNLDLNSWNCSCQLLDLATFLSAFIQQPDKTLYNGRRMVCVSADNPAVTTVLELTDANCVPSNRNITVQLETIDSVTPQVYARDLAITAVLCFTGGIGLALLVVLIYYQVSRRKNASESHKQKETEEGSGPVTGYLTNHRDVGAKQRELFMQAHQLLDSKSIPRDTRAENYGSRFRVRADENLMCPNCKVEGSKLNQWDNGMNGVMQTEQEGDHRRMRMFIMEEEEKERKKLESQQDILERDIPHNGSSRYSSRQWKHTFSRSPDTLAAYNANNDIGVRSDIGVKSRQPGMLHCKSCHRTYGKSAQNMRERRIHSNMSDTSLFDDSVPQIGNGERSIDYNRFHAMKSMKTRRQTRNVTFDKERKDQRKARRTDVVKISRNMERGVEKNHKGKLQSSGLLKSKLLRKTKVHPKRKTEQERSNSKESEDRRHGKRYTEQLEGKESSGEQSKGSSKKGKKTSVSEGLIEDEDEKDGEKDQKVKAAFKSVQNIQSNAGDQGEAQLTAITPATSTTDPSHPTIADGASIMGQGLTVPYQGAGVVPRSPQLSSQQPFLFSATDIIHSTSHLLQGSAGSQRMSSNLPLEGGALLLNTATPAGGSLVPTGPTNSMFLSMVGSRSMSLIGASDSRQEVFVSPDTSLLANAGHANPLQSSLLQTTPLHGSMPVGLGPNIALHTSHNQPLSQSQMDFHSSTNEQSVTSDPNLGQAPRTGDKPTPLASSESEPPSSFLPIKASQSIDSSTKVPKAVNTVENLSKRYSQTENEAVPGGLVESIFDGGRPGTEVHAVSERSMLGEDIFPQAASTQSTSSSGSSMAASPLLKQEYLSEEGGSSPRRKLRLVLPEKTSSREPTALEKKIR